MCARIASPQQIEGGRLARNSVFNLLGQGALLLAGLTTIPIVVRALGTERFGLLALAWIVLGYFSVFDLGLSRATAKYIAESLGRERNEQVPDLLWSSVVLQFALGLAGAALLFVLAPSIATGILRLQGNLVGQVTAMFRILAAAVPFVLVSGSFAGLLEAHQRFGLLNIIRVSAGVLTYLVTLVGAVSGQTIQSIVSFIAVTRVLALGALILVSVVMVLPAARRGSFNRTLMSRLFRYGVWVVVSSAVSPLLVYLDRFLLASLLSTAAVAYYVAPYEAVTRLTIIPASLGATLFPAFSSLEGTGDRSSMANLVARSIKYMLLTVAPLVVLVCVFAGDLLRLWLGADFADQSTDVLRVLALAVLVNSLAQILYALLQGGGRPDLPAKFHLFELPVYALAAWWSISRWGIVGAGLAWMGRVMLDALLLLAGTSSFGGISLGASERRSLGAAVTAIGGLAAVGVLARGLGLLTVQGAVVVFTGSCMVFGLLTWRLVLDEVDRRVILKALRL